MPHDLQQPARDTASGEDAPLWTPAIHRRFILATIVVLCVVLLAVLPPYISINRYGRRVAVAISGALGRPVHFDRISLHVLPLPGLTIENFVVNEDPAFGAEPVLRAGTVEARVRFASLWRRRIEVSRILLEAPSVNLVHRPSDGQWNLQSILLQASQLNSAPTAQARAGDAPRFPYIEATDARINFKSGIDKLPFSIKETDFALWLPEPDQWHLRLTGRPVRTDTDVSDVGLLRVEGTLGRAPNLAGAPIDLSASWKATPIGEASKLTVGYDLGWRGETSANATLRGTVGQAKLTTDLHLLALRRADFVPEHTAEIDAHCEAVTGGILRSLHDLRCAVPTNNETSIFSVLNALRSSPAPGGVDAQSNSEADNAAKPGVLLLEGDIPNVLDWRTIHGTASLSQAPANSMVAWLRLFSQRIQPDAVLGGTFHLTASTSADTTSPGGWTGTLACECILPVRNTAPASAKEGVAAAKPPSELNTWAVAISHAGAEASVFSVSAHQLASPPDDVSEPPSARESATGRISTAGYTLTYSSADAARATASLLPMAADEMPAGTAGPLQAQHLWGRPTVWNVMPSVPNRSRSGHPRHRQ